MQRKPEIKGVDAFIKQSKDSLAASQPEQTNASENSENYLRRTYYLTQRLVNALYAMEAEEKMKDRNFTLSVVVRNALDAYIPKKYFTD